MIESIYISRNIEEVALLHFFCQQHGLSLTAASQISFIPQPFNIQKSFDVICFSSPRSIDYFLAQQPLPSHVKIACVGSGTADYLDKKGLNADFKGPCPGDPQKNAGAFRQWLGTKTVLFPQSNLGLGNLQLFITPEQMERIVVYETAYQSKVIHPHDLYIFTSPSNVDGFLLKNPPPKAEIIAWGKSTAKALFSRQIHARHTLMHSKEIEVIKYLETQIK